MRKPAYLLLALLFALTPLVCIADTAMAPMAPTSSAKAAPYLDPATFDLKAIEDLLPNPPADDSATTKGEFDLIVQKQKALTPAEAARIKNEQEHLSVYLFSTVLGPWFTKKNLPQTDALFQRVGATAHPIVELAKDHWDRLRPFQQDRLIHPPLPQKDLSNLSKNPSYPSGHSTFGTISALILAELSPDQKDALIARGQQIGDDRVLAGVHFPSDVAAGHTLGQAIFDKLMANPDFQADLSKAKAEMAAVRAKS